MEDSHSLKDRRHYVKSLKDRLRARFNVAVAEIGETELWQSATVAVVTVSSDQLRAAQVLESAERDAANLLGRALAGATTEWLL